MSYQAQPAPAKGSRRSGLLGLGIVLLLGGVGAGAALFVVSGSQYQDAVKNLQRAPVGCDTDFNFTETGTFTFYTETKGKVGSLRGDCANSDTSYNHDQSSRVQVDLTLTDSNGDKVDLGRGEGASYDKGGYIGTEVRTLDLNKPGKYTLSVQSDDTDFAIAVGRNPKADADSLQKIAIGVAIAGVVLGGLLILLGLRRKPAPPAPTGFTIGANMSGYAPVGQYPAGGYPAGGYPTGVQPPPGQPNWPPTAPPVAPPNYGNPNQPYQPPGPPQAPPPPWGTPHQ
jgi:hypothetical protein